MSAFDNFITRRCLTNSSGSLLIVDRWPDRDPLLPIENLARHRPATVTVKLLTNGADARLSVEEGVTNVLGAADQRRWRTGLHHLLSAPADGRQRDSRVVR